MNIEPTGTGAQPGPIGEVTYMTQRGRGPESEGCGKASSTSCDDLGTLTLHFELASDPDSDPTAVGYRLRVTGGTPPPGLQIPSEPLLSMGPAPNVEGSISLVWIDGATDDQESIDFSLTLTPVDSNGNEGPTSPVVRVHDEGTDGGCNVHHRRAGTIAAPLALVALALFRRRFRAR